MNNKLRSKDIASYFDVNLSDLKPDVAIPFDIHLYFQQNQHIMVFRKGETVLTQDFFSQYAARGIEKVWIHTDDLIAFQTYLNPPKPTEEAAPPSDSKAEITAETATETATEAATEAETEPEPDLASEPEIPMEPPTDSPPELQTGPDASLELSAAAQAQEPEPAISADPESESTKEPPAETVEEEKVLELVVQQPKHSGMFAQLMNGSEIDEKKKMALAAKTARTILKQTTEPWDVPYQIKANKAAARIVRELLEKEPSESQALLNEIWEMSEMNTNFAHATNVSTYTVLLALAFGKTDKALLADLALAGLLHDIGISQVSADITSLPWKTFDSEHKEAYSEHVEAGLELINAFGPDVPVRVKSLIQQHHEKFDGTGYPQKLQGFGLDGAAQLLAIAEYVDSIASGQWDGVKRTYKEALVELEQIEKSRTFPEHFNPEVLSAVIRWTSS